ncbi:MAG TPA: response regulator [Nitrospirales bacterium]|nr:response regulator [Nitrospirales bacterium]
MLGRSETMVSNVMVLFLVVLLANKNSWSGTRISTRKNGESYDEEITISALIGKSDESHEDYFICIRRDITERKRLEAELRDKELSVLQSANEKLLEAAKSQRDFMATMSHELRTPLNAILGLAEILEEGIYGKLVSKQNEAVQTISNSGRHLLSLINDILEIRKIDAGHTSIKTCPVSAAEVAQESLALARNTTKNKTITFETIVSERPNMVQADARRLKQILVNLLANAIKFTADGGTVSIEIKASKDPKMLDFLVTDTGIGIADNDLESVFSPFFQVDSELARSYEGTGLGLALVTRFVNLHQGRISVDSELEQGTVFTVSIPRAIHDASDAMHSSATLPTIMTIEIEDTLAREFETLNVNIKQQHTGFDAEEKIEIVQPDLVVVSSPLADISSHQLVRQLKDNPKTKHIPVVLVTNEDESVATPHTSADLRLTHPLTAENYAKILAQLGTATSAIVEPKREESLVLLVDDNPANIPHVRDYLVFKGYAVEIASSGEEAIAKVASIRPDVVLMDIQMPGISGFTAIERLRENAQFDSVKIIAVTALASEEDRNKCIDIGANDYLSKPFQLSKLCKTIQKALEPKV